MLACHRSAPHPKQRRVKRMLLAALCAACLSACAAPVAAPSEPPAATPAAVAAPVPTVFSVNPVSAYYAAYTQDADDPLTAFRAALEQDDSAASLEASMRLERHLAAIDKARVSVGRLTDNGADRYAGTLFGAASGSGTMTYHTNTQTYEYSFSYTDSTLLRGVMLDTQLVFSLCNTSVQEVVSEELDQETGEMIEITENVTVAHEPYCTCSLIRSGNTWTSCVQEGRRVSALELSPGAVLLMDALLPENTEDPDMRLSALRPYAQSTLTYANGELTYFVQNHS